MPRAAESVFGRGGSSRGDDRGGTGGGVLYARSMAGFRSFGGLVVNSVSSSRTTCLGE